MGKGGGISFHSRIEPPRGVPDTHGAMGKTKSQATGDGYLGEIMVHRTTGAAGIVDNVHGASAGWTPEITLKLKDGSFMRGRLNEFREPRTAERKQFSPS